MRLNIESEWWGDDRRIALAMRLGCRLKADGMMVNAWLLAQKYWCEDNLKRNIPKDVFSRSGLTRDLVEAGLATELDDGFYIKGTEEHCAWYFKAKESGKNGGKASAEKRIKNKAAKTKKNQPLTVPQGGLEDPSRVSKENQPSYSFSSSFSKNSFISKEIKEAGLSQPPPENVVDLDKIKVREFIATYVKAHGDAYGGARPPLSDGKLQGRIKKFLKDWPLETAKDLIQVYYQMKNPWFLKKNHDFETFMQNLTVIHNSLQTGKEHNETEAAIDSLFKGLRNGESNE